MDSVKKLIHTILSISGFIPEHMTWARGLAMLASVLFTMLVLPSHPHLYYAVSYFAVSACIYLGFIYIVLPKNGLRLGLMERYGEDRAYLYYEGFLAFAFFHNGASLSFISTSSAGSGIWGQINPSIIIIVSALLFVTGLVVKIWAAYVVGVPIYYWKDMFVGRKISDFVATGPYKYLNNPMYGIGQVQVYAMAIYYNSFYGLIFGVINQMLVFLFYFSVEKPFIQRTYMTRSSN
ncbi:MAG: hypothetical protein JNM57_06890 [Cyclobacteriaceae bacterium]|nr:hypothetical protein [Cyclobacteriaceae bacterium]